jgi:pyruvate formate lyase activating enzyme
MSQLNSTEAQPEQVCRVCGERSPLIADRLGVCIGCIRERPEQALSVADQAHVAARRLFDLPERPPRAEDGRRCGLCVQDCRIGEGQRGYCGLREVRDGRLRHLAGTPERGLLHWYRDALPTNCVADPVCAGHTQRGKHNLAVFYASCTVDCLFCQNYHFRQVDPAESDTLSAEELADLANDRTFCVCYFGGDPASQMMHALAAGRRLAERGLAVCWETNGTARPSLMDRALDLALASGGCVKFDLKAYHDTLHRALTGASNRHTLENVSRAAARFDERPQPPPLVVSTLLVPGYVDVQEVERIARFVADQNRDIPYVLLGFAPHFLFPDLPRTSVRHADEAEAAARETGLTTVRIGNRHLLSRAY